MTTPPTVVSVMTTDSFGGAEYANVDLLDALAARGWRATLITDRGTLAAGTRVRTSAIDLGPKLSRRNAPRMTLRLPLLTWRLRRALAAEAAGAPVDVTLLHFKKEQLMTPLLRGGLTRRIVWAEWGPLPLSMRRGPARWCYLAAARRADHILCVSDETAASLAQVGVPADRLSVLPPVVSATTRFDPAARGRSRRAWGATDATFVVGCVSRLSASKRIDAVIEAVARLDDDVRLIIAGSGDDEPRLRRLAEPLGERVRFLPTVRGQVSEVLSGFDIQIFAPQPQEGLPRSLMLGMLMGLSVLATGPEGAAGLLSPDAVARPAHDPQAVAALLERRRHDPELRRREGDELQRVAAERFDPAATVLAAERALLGRSLSAD